jgi:hypothetical protein
VRIIRTDTTNNNNNNNNPAGLPPQNLPLSNTYKEILHSKRDVTLADYIKKFTYINYIAVDNIKNTELVCNNKFTQLSCSSTWNR